MSGVARIDEPENVLTRAEYRHWADGRAGRFERINGRVVAMAPERIGHTRVKGEVFAALRAAIASVTRSCEVLVDGPTIEVGESDYEPDVIVRCGSEPLHSEKLSVSDPMIIAEVLSPTTRRVDVSQKLVDYLQVSSVQHYLIVFADRVRVIHHRRTGDRIETRLLTDGDISLEPPGLIVPVETFYPKATTAR